ncbi:response regulator [Candidatus Bathyarchaeota archaeon]|nr:response regulator [Candidatus Bathyarchaeota archaeon]
MNDSILVIDDDPDVGQLVDKLLKGMGYKVYTASNGEEGLTTANNVVPGVIMLDIVMPGMSGLEVCKYLKSISTLKNTPVIIVTESAGKRDIELAKQAGADWFLKKPFNEELLIQLIERLLEPSQLVNPLATAETLHQALDSQELLSLLHSLLISFQNGALNIIPSNRHRHVFSAMANSLYSLSRFSLLKIMEPNDVEATLFNFAKVLQRSGIAENVTVKREEMGRSKSMYSMTLVNCMFGRETIRNFETSRFVCPFALFAAFLAQESSHMEILPRQSEKWVLGCKTVLEIENGKLTAKDMNVRG